MSKNKVLVLLPLSDRQMMRLTEAGGDSCDFVCVPGSRVTARDVADAVVVVGNLPLELLPEAHALKLLQLNSAGAEAYLKAGVMPAGVKLCNATGAYSLAVGEHMLAMTFTLIRHFAQYRDLQHEHRWQDCGSITSVEGASVLVLGSGDIGGSYAAKMKALGATRVVGIRRTLKDKPAYIDAQYTMDSLDELLGQADIVAMVLPGGPATRHTMDLRRLKLMKKGAYLINVGRGEAIDSAALLQVLKDGPLAGAAIDVTDPEPLPADSPLWDIPNLFITPHVAGNFFLPATLDRIVDIAADNLKALLEGRALRNDLTGKTA